MRTIKPRNRLILELMARGGLRIGEGLKLTPHDIEGRDLTLRTPKSGKEQTVSDVESMGWIDNLYG